MTAATPRIAPSLLCALAFSLVLPLGAAPAAAQDARRVPQSEAEITLSFAPVVKAAAPAVVNIYAKKVVKRQGRSFSPFAGDPFFERFFRGLMPRGRRVENSLGSGVIVRPDGLVVSNHHVVGEATENRVVLSDKREFDAEVVLTDEGSDLAVLRLEGAEDLPTLELRDSDDMEVGDLVLAIGNPFGVGQTVTSGIISAQARDSGKTRKAGGYFLQTDAAINPGNSGGALVDMQGRLVGVNTAILSQSGGSIGIGFAVPSDLVRQVVAQAEAGRSTLARPWAGLSGQPVDGELAEGLGLERPMGIVIADLHPLSPFAEAGLSRGDVLLSIDGEEVGTPAELEFRLAARGVGAEAEAEFLSRGKRRIASLSLAPPPETPPRDERVIESRGPFAGLRVANLSPALASELGLKFDAEGVIVLDAPRAQTRRGFRPGDRILSINGRKDLGTKGLAEIAASPPDSLAIELEREGRAGTLRFSR